VKLRSRIRARLAAWLLPSLKDTGEWHDVDLLAFTLVSMVQGIEVHILDHAAGTGQIAAYRKGRAIGQGRWELEYTLKSGGWSRGTAFVSGKNVAYNGGSIVLGSPPEAKL
jgi:hypothetical protein